MEVRPKSPYQPEPEIPQEEGKERLDPYAVPKLAVSNSKGILPAQLPPTPHLAGEIEMLLLATSSDDEIEGRVEKQIDLRAIKAIIAQDGPLWGLFSLVKSVKIHGDFKAANAILEAIPSLKNHINTPDPLGETLYMVAVSAGDIASAKWLEKHGADVSGRDGNNRTPLMRVILEERHIDVFEEMLTHTFPLNNRYSIDAKDFAGLTALAYALYANRMDLVTILLECNANLEETLNEFDLPQESRKSIIGALTAGVKLSNEDRKGLFLAIDEKLALRLIEQFNKPIDDKTISKINAFMATRPIVEALDIDPQAFRRLQEARIKGSGTLYSQSQAMEERVARDRALASWVACDVDIRKKALANEPLTLEDIHLINARLNTQEHAGTIRQSPIFGGGAAVLRYAPESMLNDLCERFYEELNEGIQACANGKENPIALASWAYQALLSIHPYTDANGRTCRMVADYILQRFGLPPMALEDNVELAVFSLLQTKSVSPEDALKIVFEGVKNSYRILGYEV